MNHDAFRQTLNELYKYNGYEGVVRYFTEHTRLSRDDAEGAANAWGYYSETPVELKQTRPGFFKRIFGIK